MLELCMLAYLLSQEIQAVSPGVRSENPTTEHEPQRDPPDSPPPACPHLTRDGRKEKQGECTYGIGSVLGGRILLDSPGGRSNIGPCSSMQFAELLSGLQRTLWYLALCTGRPAQTSNHVVNKYLLPSF